MPPIQATIATDRASRYLAQLCEHLNQIGHQQSGRKPRRHARMRSGHRPDVQRIDWNDTHGVIEFPFGACELAADGDGLTIRLAATDPRSTATPTGHVQRTDPGNRPPRSARRQLVSDP